MSAYLPRYMSMLHCTMMLSGMRSSLSYKTRYIPAKSSTGIYLQVPYDVSRWKNLLGAGWTYYKLEKNPCSEWFHTTAILCHCSLLAGSCHYNDVIMGTIASQIASLASIYLLSRLIRRRSKKTSKIRVNGLCAGNSPQTGEFPAQMASNAENVSIWWRHHGTAGQW